MKRSCLAPRRSGLCHLGRVVEHLSDSNPTANSAGVHREDHLSTKFSTNDRHGRRRALAASPGLLAAAVPSAHTQSRRDAIRTERGAGRKNAAATAHIRSAVSTGLGQKAGMVLAAAGLALAVTMPTTTASLADSVSDASVVIEPAVMASAGAPLAFDRPQVSSRLDADGKLHQTLAVSADHVTAAAAKGVLSAPLDSLQQTSGFGGRVNPLTGEMGEFHTGQDYGVPCGSAVRVAAGGTVAFAGWHPDGGGNRIVVDHGNGLATTYNHLSEIGVTVGQKLERGAQIALSGSTGASTGCHLHFEVMVDNAPVDPLGWL